MTSLPRRFCPECEKPFEGTVVIYGLTGEHWECHEVRITVGNELKEDIFDSKWKPVPDKLEGLDACGWLAPDGKFYGCRPYVHIALGDALDEYFYERNSDDPWRRHGSSAHLEEIGWGHITNYGFSLRNHDRAREPTQAQLDTLWDWYVSVKDQLDENDKDLCILKWDFEWLFQPKE